MKNTLAWFDAHGIPTVFHDYKKAGVPEMHLVRWCNVLGWSSLLNARGTTWRKLLPEQQAVTTQSQAVALMCAYPSLIRRPVIEMAGKLLVGFDPDALEITLLSVSESSS